MKYLRAWLFVVFAILVTVSPARAEAVRVFAAASMKNAVDQAALAWKAASGKDVTSSYGSSATLARQIAQAAPVDIFISADEDWMNDLAAKDLIKPATRKDLVGNSLVLAAAASQDFTIDLAKVSSVTQVLGDEKLAMADVASVPAGKYGKQALEKLGLWANLQPRIVMQENVRAALALLARGEARLGIVYGSDVVAEPKVRIVATFPETSHKPIRYPAAIVKTSGNEDALSFLAYLQSSEGQAIFQKNGFTLLP